MKCSAKNIIQRKHAKSDTPSLAHALLQVLSTSLSSSADSVPGPLEFTLACSTTSAGVGPTRVCYLRVVHFARKRRYYCACEDFIENFILCMYIFDRSNAVEERIWLSDVTCQGNEEFIHECTHSGFGSAACNHSQDVGVICERKVFFVE